VLAIFVAGSKFYNLLKGIVILNQYNFAAILNPAAILNFNASKPFLLFFFSSKSTSKTNENDFYYIWQWQYTNVHFWSVINFLREKVPLCSPCRPVRNFNLLHVIILQFCFVLITRAKIKKKKLNNFIIRTWQIHPFCRVLCKFGRNILTE
jgi:hypothetical protein